MISRTLGDRRLAAFIVLAIVAIAWLTTLQADITAGNDSLTDRSGLVDPLMDDSGEFVVAWHTWGVTHPPGYPLLNLLGNLLTRPLGWMGASPAAAAGLVSFGFALAALLVVGELVRRHDPRGVATASAMLLPPFGGLMWLYASVAEVYAFGVFLALALLALALVVGERPGRRAPVLALGLVFGLAVGHHRTLVALVPALALAVWPALPVAVGRTRRGRLPTAQAPGYVLAPGWLVWLGAAALAFLALGVYAYLPLAAMSGSPWVYGRSPATWEGLIDAVIAREYAGQIAPPTALPEIAAALASRGAFLATEVTPAGLALGLIGLLGALAHPSTRRRAVVLAVAAGGYWLAPVGQHLLIGTHLLIMVASATLAVAWGLGSAAWSAGRPWLAWAGLGLSVLVAGHAWRAHRADVVTYTRDPAGRRLIDAVAALDEPSPVVVESWSPRYFALAYGKWATGELTATRLIDARADLAGVAAMSPMPPVLYTTPHMLYLAPPYRWSERLGTPIALESAGDGLVAIRRTPRPTAGSVESRPRKPAEGPGPDVVVDTARAWWAADGDIRLAVVWRAVRAPTADYDVFVHATDRPAVHSPDDILAQGDRTHPVYGFYPTTRWRSGEQVRDDYRIAIPDPLPGGRRPTHIELGLYTVDAGGAFHDVLRRRVAIHAAP